MKLTKIKEESHIIVNKEKTDEQKSLIVQDVDEFIREQEDKKERERREEKAKKKEEKQKKGFVKSTELLRIKAAQEIYHFDYKYAYKKFSLKYQIARYRERKQRKKLYLVQMFLRNGKYDFFYVATNEKNFEYKDGLYIIDPDCEVEDTHSKLAVLNYHQDIALPFKISHDIDEINDLIQDKAINPVNLKQFKKSTVIEKVLKGEELSDELRLIKILLIVSLLFSVITMIMVARSQGWI